MSVQGVKAIQAALLKNGRAKTKGLRVGLKKAGFFLQRESQKIVPIDTTDLRESASTIAEGTDEHCEVTVGYATNYALFVHEDLEARHKPGKQAKYLERPLREKRDRLRQIVLETVQGMK